MSDPQDLLYTNQFISENIITKEELNKETTYYERFKEYIDNNSKSDTEKYIENNNYESSDINIDKTLFKKWPINNKKNHYPLFDSYINDISVNRYRKEIITKMNIDSRNRDLTKYIYPNSFILDFPKKFTNIKKIVINDIIFPNDIQSISNYNNNLAWQYASENYLINNNIDLSIIPVPDNTKQISFSSLPNAVYTYTVTAGSGNIPDLDNYLVYQTQVIPSNYTVLSLQKNIRSATSAIIHGANLSDTNTNIIEQPYLAYPFRLGTPHLFTSFIDPTTSVVKFVNRIEEVDICAIQTFSPYENNFIENDLFYYFSSQYITNKLYTLDRSLIYILVPASNDITYQYFLNVNCIYTPNPFPLVVTGLSDSVGDLDSSLINFTEFYDINIYLQNGYTQNQLDSISYYKYIDTINFHNNTNNYNKIYLRFGLRISLGNVGGKVYNPNGRFIRPSITENIIFSDSLKNIINNYGNTVNLNSINATFINSTNTTEPGSINGTFKSYNGTSGLFTDFKISSNFIKIGRALLFRWIFDQHNGLYVQYEINTINEKKRSLLHNLAWPIANQTDYIYTLDLNNGFKFVHTNYQSTILNKNNININSLVTKNIYPCLSLNLQKFGNDYFFVSNSYIFLKITFNCGISNEVDHQILNAVSLQNLQYNQNYMQEDLFNVGIGEDYTCISSNNSIPLYKKDSTNILAKILLSNVPSNTDTTLSNIINNNSFVIYYDNCLNNVDSISIDVYDYDNKILTLKKDFSFTLVIHEIKDILKETLVNTKTNNVDSTGHII